MCGAFAAAGGNNVVLSARLAALCCSLHRLTPHPHSGENPLSLEAKIKELLAA